MRRTVSIEVVHLTKSFDGSPVVVDATFLAPSGELVALLGPSGSGKTSLLRLIAGLELPDSGTILFHGHDVTNVPARERNVGFVFQHYALFQHMTVSENIGFGLSVRDVKPDIARERVRELLQLVQLEGFEKRYPRELSGGQRQRVALARALASRPRLLLLDEPFGSLDARVRRELRQWLRRLHDDIHTTSVFVTHDQEEAFALADRVVMIDHGRLQQIGTPDQILNDPSNAFVLDFVRADARVNTGASRRRS